MWVLTLLSVLLCAVCVILCTERPTFEYRFVNQNLTWVEAQQFCRQHYHDLACVSSPEDNRRLPRPTGFSAPVWIGMYDDPTDKSQWRWSATGSSFSFGKWRNREPAYYLHAQLCGVLHSIGWYTAGSCSYKFPAFCYSGSSPKVFNKSRSSMSWSDALTYCRKHYTDLAVIESSKENTAALAVRASNSWFGMHRYTGRWSDNRTVTFSTWSRPTVYRKPFCAAEDVHNSWQVSSCQEKRPFYCQEESKTKRVLKIRFSGHNLDKSVINQLMLDEIQSRFEAAGRTDVKTKWKTAPEKQERKKKKSTDCSDL